MNKLLALMLVALMAGGVFAQDNDNTVGLFFSDDIAAIVAADDPSNPDDEAFHPATNFDNDFAAFNGYLVLLYPTVESVAAYELGLSFAPEEPFILNVSGPNGWTNFGNSTNHLCGYQTPLPAGPDGGMVLSTLNMLYTGTASVEISITPSDPESIPGVPAIADGNDPTILLPMQLVNNNFGYQATINGEGTVATESHSWSNVKSLF
jgi:hypothetical protein